MVVVASPVTGYLQLFRRRLGWGFEGEIPIDSAVTYRVRGDTLVALGYQQIRVAKKIGTEWVVRPAIPFGTMSSVSLLPGRALVAGGYRVLSLAVDMEGEFAIEQEITEPEPVIGSNGFGKQTIAADGDLLAVGAYFDSEAGPQVGAVHVYRRISGVWTWVQKIVPDAAYARPGFGDSMVIEQGRLVIGAVRSANAPVSLANGYVNLYQWNGSAFELTAHLTHPRGRDSAPSGFGHAVALRGTRLAVGAFQDDLFGSSAGAVYVFDFDGQVWRSSGVAGVEGSAGAWLGEKVAFSGTDIVASSPLLNRGVAAVVFGSCSVPPNGGSSSPCVPGLAGLTSYIMRWMQNDPWADIDHDGEITNRDLLQFINEWLAGCP